MLRAFLFSLNIFALAEAPSTWGQSGAKEKFQATLQKAKGAKKMSANDTKSLATATVAGGCFWGMEDLLRKIKGVQNTFVGYTGGHLKNATYNDVKTGSTGHAEAVQISFDPKILSFEELLLEFFRIHDPTTANQQGNDIGTQYRSAIFYHGLEQKVTAENVIARVNKSGKWKKPVVTQVLPAGEFYRAEDYHQDYLQKNEGGYTCHFRRDLSF